MTTNRRNSLNLRCDEIQPIVPGGRVLFLIRRAAFFHLPVIARDGRVVWFQCDARMVHCDEKPSFIQGLGFDVTKLKDTEASLTRARSGLETRVEEKTRDLVLINVRLMSEIDECKRAESLLTAAKEAAETAARVKSEFMANLGHPLMARTPPFFIRVSRFSSNETTVRSRKACRRPP